MATFSTSSISLSTAVAPKTLSTAGTTFTTAVSPTVNQQVFGFPTFQTFPTFPTTFPPIQLPPAPPTPPTPATPTATASDLQILMSSIPIAQDGHVITADFHNALRLALVAIANRLGIGPVSEEITITNAPRLSPVTGAAAWDHDYGFVKKGSGIGVVSGNVRGWMEMELPDGARIKKMAVFGTTTGAGTLKIKLRRQKIADPSVVTDLVVIEIPDGFDTTKGMEGDVTVPGTGAGNVAIEEFRIVNNREQKYLLIAELDTIDQLTSAQFHSVQIVCGR